MPEPGDVHIGPDHLEVAADRGALAAILDARGRHREAQQTLRHVLSVLETVLGPDHYEVACHARPARCERAAHPRLRAGGVAS